MIAALGAVPLLLVREGVKPPGCSVAVGTDKVELDTEQALDATIIAASAAALNLPDHAVTIAIATADQESKLHNLPYGDMDSLGLFQQRPSQGWGTAAQVQDAHFAATAFLLRLTKVPGWQDMPVAQAAQAVQHSASGDAYGRWEGQARILAVALTGQAQAALRCHFVPTAALDLAGLQRAARVELPGTLGAPAPSMREGWRQAAWLVGHGEAAQLRTVAFAGQRWTASSGRWRPDPGAGNVVTYG